MAIFNRGISNQQFITALNNDLYWQRLIADTDLFAAIRLDKVHVYHYGQRLCEIRLVRGALKWESHKRYLGIDEVGYMDITNQLERLDEIKENTKTRIGKEKQNIKRQVLDNADYCVLDIEIAFGQDVIDGNPRLDFVNIEKARNEKMKLVFYEAKQADNPNLESNGTPKVFIQMAKYEHALKNHLRQAEILRSYETVYKNVMELNLNNKDQLVQMIGENFDHVEIDPFPRLIIFDVDEETKNNKHISRLKSHFGEERALLIEKNNTITTI